MSGFNSVETKWNADNEKMAIVISLEQNLTEAFAEYDYDKIYTLLRVYRLNADPKFNDTDRKTIKKDLDNLSKKLILFQETKKEEDLKEFFLLAEDFFLAISRGLKEAGIYFREGKNASHAVLQRG